MNKLTLKESLILLQQKIPFDGGQQTDEDRYQVCHYYVLLHDSHLCTEILSHISNLIRRYIYGETNIVDFSSAMQKKREG